MKNKTFQQWLEEMDKLDLEATAGPWNFCSGVGGAWYVSPANGAVVATCGDGKFVATARNELPRAVRVIKLLLEEQCRATECTEDLKALNAKIEKILNEEGGEG